MIQKKVMKGFQEKWERPHFLRILAQNGQFWTVFGQSGRIEIFSNEMFFIKAVKEGGKNGRGLN